MAKIDGNSLVVKALKDEGVEKGKKTKGTYRF